ncbi:MAG: dienelactone hydrolase family protein [Solitalea sp.]
MHATRYYLAGWPHSEAKKVLILLHGRGDTAQGITEITKYLPVDKFAIVVPEAARKSWYPHSFMAKPEENEPWLSSALQILKKSTDELEDGGFPSTDVYLLGFSQGACLALEFAARNAKRWAGVIGFTGGLIGDRLYRENYSGDFGGTPFFIGTGDPDSHVPLERVRESVQVLEEMNAKVDFQVYPGRPHTISRDELERASQLMKSGNPAGNQ